MLVRKTCFNIFSIIVVASTKLSALRKAIKMLLYTPLLKWYLAHDLQIASVSKISQYTSSRHSCGFLKRYLVLREKGFEI